MVNINFISEYNAICLYYICIIFQLIRDQKSIKAESIWESRLDYSGDTCWCGVFPGGLDLHTEMVQGERYISGQK